MTTKPASGSSEPIDDGIEDSIDDSLEDLLLQARDTSLENPVKPANGSHEASQDLQAPGASDAEGAAAEPMSDNSAEIALDIAEDAEVDEVDQAAATLRPGTAMETVTETAAETVAETDGGIDAAVIPIPDVISADSPNDVPRGGIAGDATMATLPVSEQDVVVNEDEVRVKVEAVPSDDPGLENGTGDGEPAAAVADDVLPVPAADAGGTTEDGDTLAAEGAGGTEGDSAAVDAAQEAGDDAAAEASWNTHEGPTREVATPVARPSITDDVVEESTKVEPYVTAMRAAASMSHGEEPEAGLATQAREERDRALRQSSTLPGPRTPATTASQPVPAGNVHFDDSENDLKLDDDTETETPSDLHRLSPGRDGARGPTPPQGYPGRRLPTPSPGLLQGPGGAAYALATSPGLARMTPSKTIPGFKSPRLSSAIFNTVRLPLGGLLAVLGAAFGGGLLIGAVLWRVGPGDVGSQAAHEQQAEQNAPAVAAPVDQPAAPAAPTAAAPAAEPQPTAATAPAGSAPATAAAPSPGSPQEGEATSPPTTAGRGTRPGVASAAAKPPVRIKRTASTSGKSKTVWVDPFAQ